jgi:DNA repair exonuclease SbcCD ATPase subunit
MKIMKGMLLMTLATTSALAQTVYKSPDGKSYSDKPPASGKAQPLEIDTSRNVIAPEQAPQQRAQEQQLKQEWASDRAREAEAERSREEKIAEAEARLQAAEAELDSGTKVQSGDWLGRKDGGVRPSRQRIERIEALTREVEQAKDALEKAKYSRE